MSSISTGIDSDSNFLNLKAINLSEVRPEIEKLLVNDEKMVCAFKTIRDQVVFTTNRIFTINVKGVTGKKIAYFSYPYSKIQYYNRTWETYTYQTSMTRAVDSIIENELQFFIKECKRKYNIKRLTKEKREQAENQFYKVPHIVELLNIKEELKHRA